MLERWFAAQFTYLISPSIFQYSKVLLLFISNIADWATFIIKEYWQSNIIATDAGTSFILQNVSVSHLTQGNQVSLWFGWLLTWSLNTDSVSKCRLQELYVLRFFKALDAQEIHINDPWMECKISETIIESYET